MAIRAMVKAVRDGRRLAIFPEGRITLTGALMKIYDGPGMIADRAEAAIVPVRIEGLQFHKTVPDAGQAAAALVPAREPDGAAAGARSTCPPTLVGRARRAALGRIMQDIMVDAAFRPERLRHSLFAALLDAQSAVRQGLPVVADIVPNETGGTTLTELTYRRLILGSVVLGRKLAAFTRPGEHVGVMLPNAVGTVVTFFALQSQGRVPAMMNFTAGADGDAVLLRGRRHRTILTSRRAVQKGKLDGWWRRIAAKVRVRLSGGCARLDRPVATSCAACWLPGAPERLPGAEVDPASPGAGAVHLGVGGRAEGRRAQPSRAAGQLRAAAAVVDFNPSDRVFNALPMFHAFGMTAHAAAADVRRAQRFCIRRRCTTRSCRRWSMRSSRPSCSAPTRFLTGYARKGNPLDFQSLRYIFAGAEAVRPETRAAYMAHFKKPIFEGYGATETAPVLALNTWAHAREGSVGRLLPGIEARLEPVPGIDGWRPAVGARPERDAGLSAGRRARRAAAAAGWLVRHRRYRYDRRRLAS